MGFNELCLPNEMETDVSTEFFNSESTNFENSIDPDEEVHYEPPHLGLH